MNNPKAVLAPGPSDHKSHAHIGAFLMVRRLCGNWWVFVVRGVLALLFGGFVLFAGGMLPSPLLRALALTAIVMMFAAYFFLSAIVDLVAYAEGSGGVKRSPFLVFDALVGVALCALVLLTPALEVHALVYFMGAYAVASGSLELRIALRTHTYFHTWAIAAAGISVALMGIVLLVLHLMQMQAIVHAIAIAALYTGLVRIATGFYFHTWYRSKLPA